MFAVIFRTFEGKKENDLLFNALIDVYALAGRHGFVDALLGVDLRDMDCI